MSEQTFTRNEIFIIKACKGHFNSKGIGETKAVQKILENLIYDYAPVQDFTTIKYLRRILMKTYIGVSVQNWEEFTERAFCDAQRETLVRAERSFDERYREYHISALRTLQVATTQPDNSVEKIIDLDITEDEQLQIEEALSK